MRTSAQKKGNLPPGTDAAKAVQERIARNERDPHQADFREDHVRFTAFGLDTAPDVLEKDGPDRKTPVVVSARPLALGDDEAAEREADAVAAAVVGNQSGPAIEAVPNAAPAMLDSVSVNHTSAASASVASASVSEVLDIPGKALDPSAEALMESGFGYDFSRVRVHDDSAAHDSAATLGAQAYAYAGHIVFAAGQYKPGTAEGQRLIAHELTHLVQQHAGGSFQIQRKAAPGATPAKPQLEDPEIIIEYPAQSIHDNLQLLYNSDAGFVTRMCVMFPGKLSVYGVDDAGAYKHLKDYKIKSSVLPPPYLYVVEGTGFFVFAYNNSLERNVLLGKTTSGLSDADKAIVAQWDASLNIDTWFETSADHADFIKNHVSSQFLALWVKDQATIDRESQSGSHVEPAPPKPGWIPAWETAMNKRIRELRKVDKESTDIPETFGFYYARVSGRWRAAASVTAGEDKKLSVYLDVDEKQTPDQVLPMIRDKIRMRQLNPESLTNNPKAKEQPPEVLMGLRIKAELDALIREARKAHKEDISLPDATAIVTDADAPGKVFLRLSIYLRETQTQEAPVEKVASKHVLQQALLPTPLERTVNVKSLFEFVREATRVIRGRAFKGTTEQTIKPTVTLEAYPSNIAIPSGRADFKTVTGAVLDTRMQVDMSSSYENGVLTEAARRYRGLFYTWDVYKVADILSAEEKESVTGTWESRRARLMSLMRDSRRLQGVNPVYDTEKVRENNAYNKQRGHERLIIDTSKVLGPEELRDVRSSGFTFGSATKLTPEATITLPPDPGEYVIYARAISEPDGTIVRQPSEAFYVIQTAPGEQLARTAMDENLTKIKSKKEELANEPDETARKILADDIAAMEAREQSGLAERTATDITDTAQAIELAEALIKMYRQHAGQKVSMAKLIVALPDKTTHDKMLRLQFSAEVMDRSKTPVQNLQVLIKQFTQQAAALKVLSKSLGEFAPDLKPYPTVLTPVTVLVSKLTGEAYSLIMTIGVKDDEKGGVSAMLVDVTAPKTQAKYTGRSDRARGSGGLTEAIREAYADFAANNKYGEGEIAYRIPSIEYRGTARSKQGFKQQALEYLGYAAMAAGIAALVLGTIGTGGALAFGLGVFAGVSGAAISAHNIADRASGHRLEPDLELAMDILNMVGPVLLAASSLSKMAKLSAATNMIGDINKGVTTANSVKTIGAIAKVERFVALERGFAILQKTEAGVNLVLVALQTQADLEAIKKAYPKGSKERQAMEWEVYKNAVISGTMAVVALRAEFKPTVADLRQLDGIVNAASAERNYIDLMKRHGLIKETGGWSDPLVQGTAGGQGSAGNAALPIAGDGAGTGTSGARPEHPSGEAPGTPVVQEPPAPAAGSQPAKAADAASDAPAGAAPAKPDTAAPTAASDEPGPVSKPDNLATPAADVPVPVKPDEPGPLHAETPPPVKPEEPTPIPKQALEPEPLPSGAKATETPAADVAPEPKQDAGGEATGPAREPGTDTATTDADSKTPKNADARAEALPELEVGKPTTTADGSTALLKADGRVIITSRIGKGKARKHYEKRLLSGIEVGLKGWHRAHSQGAGTGTESAHGILYAPPEVNLRYQNSGIEARIREIFRVTPREFELTLTTITKAHPDVDGKPSQRLASIEYKIEVTAPDGRTSRILEADIRVEDKLDRPRVTTSANASISGALWSVHYGDGRMLNISPKAFEKLKRDATQLEKRLEEAIQTLGVRKLSASGDELKILDLHMRELEHVRNELYEHPDNMPFAREVLKDASRVPHQSRVPLSSTDATTYLKKWRHQIDSGADDFGLRFLELGGTWQESIKLLKNSSGADRKTIDGVHRVRNAAADHAKQKHGATRAANSSVEDGSDIDLIVSGNNAGRRLIDAETDMRIRYGKDWSKMFRMNFYTEKGRLLRYRDVESTMRPEAFAAMEKEITRHSITLNMAKMMQHAKGHVESEARVARLTKQLPPEVRLAAERFADMSPDDMRLRRDKLLLEVDDLQMDLAKTDISDPDRVLKAKRVSMLQMEANMYTEEAYIGPGAMADNVSGNRSLQFERILSNLEMMEHIAKTHQGNRVLAARGYELYKYVRRVRGLTDELQFGPFHDAIATKVEALRSHPESFSAAEADALFNDYLRMTQDYVAKEMKSFFQ